MHKKMSHTCFTELKRIKGVILTPRTYDVGDNVRMSRAKRLPEKGYLPHWSEALKKNEKKQNKQKTKQNKPSTHVIYILQHLTVEMIRSSL